MDNKENIYKLEYIWLDGNDVQLIRSKIKIFKTFKYLKDLNLDDIPKWNYDGSSTNQAPIDKSELILNPINLFKNPFDENSLLILCEVNWPDGTAHSSNKRRDLVDITNEKDDDTWYGYEQEYFILDNLTGRPLGWPEGHKAWPEEQGKFYCGVGSAHVSGREFVNEHLEMCLSIGLTISGINAEVALGQWEYQVGPVPAINGADELWISRYILYRLGEKYNYFIDIDPKPFKGDSINGSGMHVNFSTKEIRENKDKKVEIALKYCKKLKDAHKEHILVYGYGNSDRLTGSNETASINEFKFAVGSRNVSIRIPNSINDKDSIGYIEDRRPGSNANPYILAYYLIKTLC